MTNPTLKELLHKHKQILYEDIATAIKKYQTSTGILINYVEFHRNYSENQNISFDDITAETEEL